MSETFATLWTVLPCLVFTKERPCEDRERRQQSVSQWTSSPSRGAPTLHIWRMYHTPLGSQFTHSCSLFIFNHRDNENFLSGFLVAHPKCPQWPFVPTPSVFLTPLTSVGTDSSNTHAQRRHGATPNQGFRSP